MSSPQSPQPTFEEVVAELIALRQELKVIQAMKTAEPTASSSTPANTTPLPRPALVEPIRAAQPEPFNGRRPEVELWLFQLERYMQYTKITGTRMVEFAETLLKGDALTWWRVQVTTNKDPTEWDEFSQMLQKQFKPINSVKAARDKLATLQQTGSVKGYNIVFLSTLLEILDISNGEILDRYIRGLKDQTRKDVEL